MAQLIFYGGLRSSEVRNLEVNDISDYDKEKYQNPQNLPYYLNRQKLRVKNSKGGKTRKPTLPINIYRDLVGYINSPERKRKLKKLKKQLSFAEYEAAEKLIFPSTNAKSLGEPWSEDKLGKLFIRTSKAYHKKTGGNEFEAITPHKGRHAFAILRLAEITLEKLPEIGESFESIIGTERLWKDVSSELARELGHSNFKTTEDYYLVWGASNREVMNNIKEEIINATS